MSAKMSSAKSAAAAAAAKSSHSVTKSSLHSTSTKLGVPTVKTTTKNGLTNSAMNALSAKSVAATAKFPAAAKNVFMSTPVTTFPKSAATMKAPGGAKNTSTTTTTLATKAVGAQPAKTVRRKVSSDSVSTATSCVGTVKKNQRPPARRHSLREPSPENLFEDEPPTAVPSAAAIPTVPAPLCPIPVVATKGRAGKSRGRGGTGSVAPNGPLATLGSMGVGVHHGVMVLPVAPTIGVKPRWSNGWTWEGMPFDAKVFLTSDEPAVLRRCYPAMRHAEGDIISRHDCVLLKSGPRRTDLPFVAKVAALWENPEDGEMMVSLLWYYRPEHTEQGRRPGDVEDEIFASRHKDTNSVACIEDKCYVLTFNEYCRYRRCVRRVEEGVGEPGLVVPNLECYPRRSRQPPGCVAPDMVFFCRRVYDFRQRRILKNPG